MDLRKHISVTAGSQIKLICQPLTNIGIDVFCFVRMYHNTRDFINFTNNSDWSLYYLTKLFNLGYPQSTHFARFITNDLLVSRENYKADIDSFNDAIQFFDIQNAVIVSRNHENYKDIYYFGSSQNLSINNFYINNIEFFNKFISYFKDRASSLIKKSRKS